MTRDEIDKLSAGKKINQYVWWKVFDMTPEPPNNDMDLLPDYSAEIAPAFSVIEEINPPLFLIRYEMGKWTCIIGFHKSTADTAPLAICRAALLAVNKE